MAIRPSAAILAPALQEPEGRMDKTVFRMARMMYSSAKTNGRLSERQ